MEIYRCDKGLCSANFYFWILWIGKKTFGLVFQSPGFNGSTPIILPPWVTTIPCHQAGGVRVVPLGSGNDAPGVKMINRAVLMDLQ